MRQSPDTPLGEVGPRIAPGSVALVQGAYFAATGVWPLLHMRSFEAGLLAAWARAR